MPSSLVVSVYSIDVNVPLPGTCALKIPFAKDVVPKKVSLRVTAALLVVTVAVLVPITVSLAIKSPVALSIVNTFIDETLSFSRKFLLAESSATPVVTFIK